VLREAADAAHHDYETDHDLTDFEAFEYGTTKHAKGAKTKTDGKWKMGHAA